MYFIHQSHEERAAGFDKAVIVEDHAIATVIAYLVDVEEDRTHLQLGYSSMRDFCRRRGGWSKSFTDLRLGASRLVQRFPPLLEALRSGKLTLSSLALLRNLFNDENLAELVTVAQRKSKTEVQELVAAIEEKERGGSVRKLPQRSKDTEAPAPPASAAPHRTTSYPIEIMASASLQAKIERARILMSQSGPSPDLGALVEAALDLFLAHHEGATADATNVVAAVPASSADVADRASKKRDSGRSTAHPAESVGDVDRAANDIEGEQEPRAGARPPKAGPSSTSAPVRTGSKVARSPARSTATLPRKPLQKTTAAASSASSRPAGAPAGRDGSGRRRAHHAGKATHPAPTAPRRASERTSRASVPETKRQKRAGNGAYMKPA